MPSNLNYPTHLFETIEQISNISLKCSRTEVVSVLPRDSKVPGAVLIRPVYPGSSAQVTAVPPDLTCSCVMEGQEEGVEQSGGESDAFGGFVLQHPLQEVQKPPVLGSL